MIESAQPATLAETASPSTQAKLWDCEVVALWSLFFTPAFGAYLHMRNWQRLGQRGKAMRSMLWFLAGIAILALDQVLSALNILSQEQSRATILVYIVFFLGWYLWPARDQRKYLAREYGNEYTRKRLYVPILFTVAAFVASDKLIPLIQAAAAYLNG